MKSAAALQPGMPGERRFLIAWVQLWRDTTVTIVLPTFLYALYLMRCVNREATL